MLIGYARVSTIEQDTALQLDALKRAGVRKVFQDKGSGVGPRPHLQVAVGMLKAGDTLVVWKLDRIARSLPQLLDVVGRVQDAGAGIRSLTEHMDTSTPMGQFTLQVLGAVAQLERSMIRERVIAGQSAAMERGKRWGPPRVLSPRDEASLVRLYRSGGHTVSGLAGRFGVSYGVARSAVLRATNPLAYYTPRR
ncbi:recombinase family protein [uncultured Hydrogenophaga sp.]|uniref:recombinase family protein n=1 Tax=uncultured Hydrogenophaga sp. TaxID=199683 RepID=UPI00258DCBDD|nr:recombinase family protein [uncultured Hydrogenophaga sp.]